MRSKSAYPVQNKSDTIYQSILDLLCSGVYKPGDKIPDERSLADELKTGRTIVRDALSRIQSQGLVIRRVGSGTYIADDAAKIIEQQDAQVLIKNSQPFNLSEITEARLLFEPDIVAMAAHNAKPTDIKRLEDRLEILKLADCWLDFKEAIYSVTRGVYEAAGNYFLISVFDLIILYRRQVKYNGLAAQNRVSEIVKNQVYSEMKEIVDAITAKNAKRGKSLSHDYLLRMMTSINL